MKIGMSFPDYEAELDTDPCDAYNNAELTLTLRLGFRQINPAGGAQSGTYNDYGDASAPSRKIVKWTPGAWSYWKTEFVKSAQRFWHGKFWLVNNFARLEYEDKGVKYRPNIWCRFKLIGADADTGIYHHVIEVVRLDKSETWFGSHSTLYDSLDTRSVQKGTASDGKPIMQRAHVHEVGHLLGLDHVDVGKPHCPAGSNTNAAACYGASDQDKQSVMGQGMQLRKKHADPWRRAMIGFEGCGNAANPTDWEAKLERHYPRTLAEAAALKAITVRPRR